MSVGSTPRCSVQVSGFASICLLTPPRRLYPLRVPRTSALPAASFRSHLAMDTLAVRLTLPLVGHVENFHLQVSAPCRAHKEKPRDTFASRGLLRVGYRQRLPAATTAAGARPTTAPALALLRLVQAQRTPAQFLADQRLNRPLRIHTRHLNEAEAARTTGFAIVDERNGFHRPVLLEQLANLRFICGERKVPNIDLRHKDTISLKKPRARTSHLKVAARSLVTNGLLLAAATQRRPGCRSQA